MIDCRKKKVHLWLKGKVKVSFQSRGRDKSVGIISLPHDEKLLARGCDVFLACVVATMEKSSQC